ncbi:unnamed protein product [Chondrus crispus]|uniref:Uncharacterized protein n=1 Tax=Chondrus crispus TaxID=2769 RepID=R7QNJ4_CHOCR|nr:unnamed protein product [Chondrus crispus]CDF39031.1 unnamed protein product [Chondrus crispus]|eukprot:XP_005718936.1 unnamed protein product [Chondrus crispus]
MPLGPEFSSSFGRGHHHVMVFVDAWDSWRQGDPVRVLLFVMLFSFALQLPIGVVAPFGDGATPRSVVNRTRGTLTEK